MRVSATEAQNRFGHELGQAERELPHVTKNEDKASKDWIAAQNELVEKVGVFGEELRPW